MSNPETAVQSPLSLTTSNYITDFWNDSCSIDELKYAMVHGGVGATTNPSIVLNVLKKELPAWRGLLNQLIEDNPTWGEEDVAWRLIDAALAAADEATQAWQSEAEAHFRKISDESFIAFPSGRNKILWDFSDPEQLMLVIRVACPSHLRLKVEQAVFRDTWRILRPGQLTKPHCDISAQ